MSTQAGRDLPRSAIALLTALANATREDASRGRIDPADADLLIAADLARCEPNGRLTATQAGCARVLRQGAADSAIDPFRVQHLNLARRLIVTPEGPADVAVDEAESPLAWLARRKGRDGQPLIQVVQLQAGERLRVDFTRAQLTPRVTANWDASIAQGRRGQAGSGTLTDMVVASRERLRNALDAAGPEFAGLLLDVCCFLKGLEDIERERRWPPRTAKVVVQLALDRLARHYGLAEQARGRACTPIRTWLDADSAFAIET